MTFKSCFIKKNHRKRHSKISRYENYKSSPVGYLYKPPVLETTFAGQIKFIFTELIKDVLSTIFQLPKLCICKSTSKVIGKTGLSWHKLSFFHLVLSFCTQI